MRVILYPLNSDMPYNEADIATRPLSDRTAILVIDSDEMILELLQLNLAADYHVDTCRSAEEAIELDLPSYSLLILDINLGGSIDGMQFTEMLGRSEQTANIPFIFCTSRDSEDEIIHGFDAGADDYIVKPFSLREMVARVRSVIRRHALRRPAAAPKPVSKLDYEGLVLHLDTQRAEIDGQALALSRTEYQILKLFMKNQGKLFTRDEIHARAWPDSEAVSARTIDVNISRLRKKLGKYAACIISRPGQGYALMSLGL